jgi:hypothetical protein
VKYPKNKMKNLMLAPKTAIPMLALCGVAIAVFDQAIRKDPSIVLFPLTASYALFGIGDTVYRKLMRRQAVGGVEPSSPPAKTGDAL